MNKATKAALLSALIFPGCGHFYLKNKLRGAIYALISAACLFVLAQYVLTIANDISERILTGDIPLNIASISAEISSQLGDNVGIQSNIASLILLLCWGVGITDSFILGRHTKP